MPGAFDVLSFDPASFDAGLSQPGVNPQVFLRVSRDGGRTWGHEQPCSVGRMGEYAQRVIFHRIGMARNFVFEVSGTDPVPYRITDAYLRSRAGVRHE